jgi:CelD/BcsL family acetyltransferase involved in cellulose biosynthesis
MLNPVKYSWNLQVVQTWAEVEEPSFVEQWRGLMNSAPEANVFFHPAILNAWTDATRSIYDIEPVYCIAEKDGVKIFLPLVLWKRNWKNAFVRMLVPAGYPDFDYHDPVVNGFATKEIMDSFWMLMRNVLAGDQSIVFDEAILCGMHISAGPNGRSANEDVCPYNDLSRYPDFLSFFGSLKKSMRKDIERQLKRLSEVGRVRFKVFDQQEREQAVAAIPELLETHSRKWPQAFKQQGFHEGLVRGALLEGILHFSEILLDDKPISWHLGFMYKRRFYYYMPVFLNEFGCYSPGKIHLYFLMEEAYRQGVVVFDFLRGIEGYKKEWANAEDALYCYQFHVKSPASQTRLLARELLMEVKKRFLMLLPLLFFQEAHGELLLQLAKQSAK